VIIGGGVGGNPQVLAQTRTQLQRRLAGYLAPLETCAQIDAFVAAPGLGANSGLLGAVALGLRHDARS
jgi:fructokinase